MNTLHEITIEVIADLPEKPTCPECGCMRFWRSESGTYNETHSINFGGNYPDEDWDDQETWIDDHEFWKCWSCDIPVTDELAEQIEQLR